MSVLSQSTIQISFVFKQSTMLSQNPTTYMEQATAFAKENISPIEPPNSGPSDLEIM